MTADPHSVARYCIHLLKTLSDLLSDTIQRQYAKELLDSIQSLPLIGFDRVEVDMIGLPYVKKIVPLG